MGNMNYVTIRSVSERLGVSETMLRRAVADGTLESLQVGNRMLIDLDLVRDWLAPAGARVGIEEVSMATGLTVSAIRRGIQEGWIPCEKPGKSYLFDLDKVLASIRRRASGETGGESDERGTD